MWQRVSMCRTSTWKVEMWCERLFVIIAAKLSIYNIWTTMQRIIHMNNTHHICKCITHHTSTNQPTNPPLKFHFFIAPWVPFPLLTPHTSTSWPGTKCLAWINIPGSRSASGVTRNSASIRFGPTPASLYCPKVTLLTRRVLASPTPKIIGSLVHWLIDWWVGSSTVLC